MALRAVCLGLSVLAVEDFKICLAFWNLLPNGGFIKVHQSINLLLKFIRYLLAEYMKSAQCMYQVTKK